MINSGVNTEGAKAGQEFKHVICDVTSIIVDDGVTLHPGYLEIKAGDVIAHYSDDPNNKQNPFLVNEKGEAVAKNPNFSVGMLLNRVEFRYSEIIDTLEAGVATFLEGMHFISMEVMNLFIEKLAAKQKADEEAAKAEQPSKELDTAPEVVEDTVMDEPIVEETTETPTEEIVTETPVEETAVVEETPEVAEVPTPEEVAPIDDTGTVSVEDEGSSEAEPTSEDEVQETPTEVEEPVAESAGAHLVDMGGISRCSVCMLTAGAIGDVDEHMGVHNGTVEPTPEPEPIGGIMTTENMPS